MHARIGAVIQIHKHWIQITLVFVVIFQGFGPIPLISQQIHNKLAQILCYPLLKIHRKSMKFDNKFMKNQ